MKRMSREASYGKTKLNNAGEDTALQFILRDPCFQRPNVKTRKLLLELLGVAGLSARAFDLIQTDVPAPPITVENAAEHIQQIRLIEVKATKAAIKDENLHGFFFGATANEYNLAAAVGDRFRFAFVVMHPEKPFFVLLTLQEVESRTRTKRIQYQVNLKGKPK